MSAPIRGQEVTARIYVDGEELTKSWVKLTNFNWTPKIENVEIDFISETFSDLDQRVDGHDVSFDAHILEASVIEQICAIQSRAEDHLPPAKIVMSVLAVFREDGSSVTGAFSEGVLKIDKIGSGGRKDYVIAGCSAKFKRFDLQ